MDDFFLNIDFNNYEIGREYFRYNKKCIFDIIREILVLETPEEIVRQKFVRYLIEELKVPKNKIEVEVPMVHFKKGSKGRADIVVYAENNEGYLIPLILVECKAPNVPLIDEVWKQAIKYNEILGAAIIVITNGNNTYAVVFDDETKEYYYIEEIPEYKEILSGGQFKYIYGDFGRWERPNFSELICEKTIKEFEELGWIGEDTDTRLYPLIFNLAGFLHDTREKFSPINFEDLKIIEDGHRYTSFGNAGGGIWEGDYRYFILEDEQGNNQIISMSIFGSLKCTDHPQFGNRNGNTIFVVSIDDFEKRHNSLQLNLDKYTKIKGNEFTIWHDGTITIGKNGAAKRKELIEYIKSKDMSLVDSNGNIILGTFDCNKEILWKQKNTRQFIRNAIKYAILRDEFRRIKQSSL